MNQLTETRKVITNFEHRTAKSGEVFACVYGVLKSFDNESEYQDFLKKEIVRQEKEVKLDKMFFVCHSEDYRVGFQLRESKHILKEISRIQNPDLQVKTLNEYLEEYEGAIKC